MFSASSGHVFTFVLAFLILTSATQKAVSAALTASAKGSSSSYTNYLKTACSSTTYPNLCYKSLSAYTSTIKTDDLKLCKTALTVSLKTAKSVSSAVTGISKQKGLTKIEAAVIKDCVDVVGDALDELKQSAAALGSLKGPDVQFQIDNIKTWVSAAITNENTCTDGFEGTKVRAQVKNKIRKNIVNLAELTSNALALINKLNITRYLV